MTKLYLSDNYFQGPIDLTQLPENLEELFLDGNAALCGETDFRQLPARLEELWFCDTQLEGEFVVINPNLQVQAGNSKVKVTVLVQCT